MRFVIGEYWVIDEALLYTGSPSITSVLFDRNSTTLTCTSTGGPPTTVTWMKDGVPVNESIYQQSQIVVHTENATYENVLFNDNVANFVGTFTCEVSNVRRTVQESVALNGETLSCTVRLLAFSITLFRCVHHSEWIYCWQAVYCDMYK